MWAPGPKWWAQKVTHPARGNEPGAGYLRVGAGGAIGGGSGAEADPRQAVVLAMAARPPQAVGLAARGGAAVAARLVAGIVPGAQHPLRRPAADAPGAHVGERVVGLRGEDEAAAAVVPGAAARVPPRCDPRGRVGEGSALALRDVDVDLRAPLPELADAVADAGAPLEVGWHPEAQLALPLASVRNDLPILAAQQLP